MENIIKLDRNNNLDECLTFQEKRNRYEFSSLVT